VRRGFFLSRSLCLLGLIAGACTSSSASVGSDASGPSRRLDAATAREADTPDHATREGDARAETGASQDASQHVDAPAMDAGRPPTPVGTAVDTGAITLVGVTDDGHVVYQRGNTVKAAPVVGGPTTTLLDASDAAATNGIVVNIVHDDVFIWSNVNQTSGAATLDVWASSLTAATTLSTSSVPSLFAASADSSVIAFSDGTSADGSSTNLVAAAIASLTSHHPLATAVDPGNEDVPTCPPALAFSGAGTLLYTVVGACTPIVVDGGANGPFVVTAFPAATWTGAVLAPSATTVAVDGSGSSAAIFLPSGAIEIASLAGGAPVPIDTGPDAGTADAGADLSSQLYLSPSDAFVLFCTHAGALLASPTATASVTTLATAGAVDLDAVSPTAAFVLVDQGTDVLTGFPEGLGLASTSTAGPVATLSTGDVFLNVGGDEFTADGHYALYIAGVTSDGNGNPIGALTAAAVAAPGSPITIASKGGSLINPITGAPSNTAVALTTSQIAFVDAFDSSLGQAGQADLEVVDLSTTAPAQRVMTAADPSFVVSHDRQRILYTITFGGTTDGLYSVAVP
jgi:hypothetical protein